MSRRIAEIPDSGLEVKKKPPKFKVHKSKTKRIILHRDYERRLTDFYAQGNIHKERMLDVYNSDTGSSVFELFFNYIRGLFWALKSALTKK